MTQENITDEGVNIVALRRWDMADEGGTKAACRGT